VYDFRLIRYGDTFVVKKSSPEGYDYLLHIPRGYNDFSGPQPLLMFLHGAGEIGTDPNTLREQDPAFFAREALKGQETARFPFIAVTPICPENRWEPWRVIAVLDQVLAENKFRFQIDPDRIYLTGYSMGGFGAFETAMEFPERFAAIVPVAGGGEPNKAEKLQNVAVWVFHGANDRTVPTPSSALVVERMRELEHKDVMMNILRNAGHGIVREVYSQDVLYRWLLLKRKSRFGLEETMDRAFLPLQPILPPEKEDGSLQTADDSREEEEPKTLLDDSPGGDASNLIDGGVTGKDLTDSVVTEEPHAE
jgi:predicted peptidase